MLNAPLSHELVHAEFRASRFSASSRVMAEKSRI